MQGDMLIGHKAAREFLERCIAQDRVAHAYCFAGPKFVGKTELAEWFVGKLMGGGAERTDEDFSTFRTNPDVAVVRRLEEDDKVKPSIIIGQIRSLREKLSLSSFLNSWKVAVILEAETMTLEAANALLKTLEEPNPRTVIILLTSAWEMLPQTIRSRCQTVYLRPVPRAAMLRAFAKSKLTRDVVESAVRLSLGRPGLARQLISDKKLLQEELGTYTEHLTMLRSSVGDRLQAAEAMVKERKDDEMGRFFARCRVILHDLLLPEAVRAYVAALGDDIAPLRDLRAAIHPLRAVELLARLEAAVTARAQNVNPRLALEHFLISF